MDFLKKTNQPQYIKLEDSNSISSSCKEFLKSYDCSKKWKVPSNSSFKLVMSKLEISHEYRPSGVTLAYQRYKQEKKPVGIVFNSHGYTVSSNHACYHSLFLAEKGFDVIGIDAEGHGLTGNIESLVKGTPFLDKKEIIVYNLLHFILKILSEDKENLGDVPIYLWGHSMGALKNLMVSTLADEYKIPLRGMVLLSPPGDFNKPMLEFEDLSNMKDHVSEYVVHLQSNFSDIRKPFLLMHGGSDNIVYISGSEKLFKGASSEDKTLVQLKGATHMIYQEWCAEQVAEMAFKWIMNRNSLQ